MQAALLKYYCCHAQIKASNGDSHFLLVIYFLIGPRGVATGLAPEPKSLRGVRGGQQQQRVKQSLRTACSLHVCVQFTHMHVFLACKHTTGKRARNPACLISYSCMCSYSRVYLMLLAKSWFRMCCHLCWFAGPAQKESL